MTGGLQLSYANPEFVLKRNDNTGVCQMYVNTAAVTNWLWRFADAGAPAAMNLYRYDDAGVINGTPVLGVARATGKSTWSGDMLIQKADPQFNLDATTGTGAYIATFKNTSARWTMVLGNATGETGSNAGTNFQLNRYSDAGAFLGAPLQINRATGDVGIDGNVSITTTDNPNQTLLIRPKHGTYTGRACRVITDRAADTGFYYFTGESSSAADTDFYVRGDGLVASDGGAAMSTPADYADMMEWSDGNPLDEDRHGLTVVMDGDKVRPSTLADKPVDVVGVVSVNPTVCGRAAWNRWFDKYLRDDWGVLLRDENGERLLNPEFRAEDVYVPRSERKEWSPIGLVGILRIRKGQVTGDRWRKMRDVATDIEEWLIR